MLTNFPSKCNGAATIIDISPHLCFICLLHLANEKGLSIQSCPNMDDLAIYAYLMMMPLSPKQSIMCLTHLQLTFILMEVIFFMEINQHMLRVWGYSTHLRTVIWICGPCSLLKN
ncbi:hypothetical protein GLYMA_13G310451v4 [Glycine max]|nr:hypothetical protein GLYMA_13G310451v4 [Glycine max]KAH1104251.1 hypothetical protein GYH30_037919 [Glycine max]